jgi:NADH-quinone oxidoreductase subunit L
MSELLQASARLAVLLPALTAVLALAAARRPRLATGLATAGAVLTLLATLGEAVAVQRGAGAGVVTTVPALPLGGLAVPLHLVADSLSAVVAVAVALVGFVVQVFSRWYLRTDPRAGVFAATVSLFLAAMLLVVQSGDLILTLVGWEVMGWCSFLLIGHDSRREAARRAAVKAFLVTRTADLAFVVGIVILAVGARTTAIPAVIGHWTAAVPPGAQSIAAAPSTALRTAALLCLLSGIAGKSAQLPFHDWLPDAMEGPTPASALIHAATMVAAGTYVLARLFVLFAASDTARLVLALVTAATMVGAAVLAFGQSDLKRLLAYSTISQIAVMLSAVAVVPAAMGPDAGILHLLSHAMFKALLFLSLGWLSVLVGGTAALTLRGGARVHSRVAVPLGIGLLSLAGVPPLVGFVSKEYVLAAAEDGTGAAASLGARVVLVALFATVALTAAYCMRAWLVLTRLTHEEEDEIDEREEAVERASWESEVSLAEMFGPVFQPVPGPDGPSLQPPRRIDPATISGGARRAVWLLVVLTVVGGAVVLSPLLRLDASFSLWSVGASLLLIAGAGLGVRGLTPADGSGDAAARLGPRVTAAMDGGLGVDGLYQLLVARPVTALAHLVVVLDRDVIDAYVRGTAVATRWAGVGAERAHTRRPSQGLVWVLCGVLAVGLVGVGLW